METGEKGKLGIRIDLRETAMLKLLNPIASRLPELIARNPHYCRLLPRLASPLLGTDPSMKIMGKTEKGRQTRFRVERIYKVTGGSCT